MKYVGLACAPADAVPETLEIADYISPRKRWYMCKRYHWKNPTGWLNKFIGDCCSSFGAMAKSTDHCCSSIINLFWFIHPIPSLRHPSYFHVQILHCWWLYSLGSRSQVVLNDIFDQKQMLSTGQKNIVPEGWYLFVNLSDLFLDLIFLGTLISIYLAWKYGF